MDDDPAGIGVVRVPLQVELQGEALPVVAVLKVHVHQDVAVRGRGTHVDTPLVHPLNRACKPFQPPFLQPLSCRARNPKAHADVRSGLEVREDVIGLQMGQLLGSDVEQDPAATLQAPELPLELLLEWP